MFLAYFVLFAFALIPIYFGSFKSRLDKIESHANKTVFFRLNKYNRKIKIEIFFFSSIQLQKRETPMTSKDAMMFPVAVSAVGIFVCLICSFIATHIKPVRSEGDVESALKLQLISTTILMVPSVYYAATHFLPEEFELKSTVGQKVVTLTPVLATFCVALGAVGGLIIGLVTEYYTSHSYQPVREVANSCKTGAATNMIYGIALGFKSAIIPVIVLALVIYFSFASSDMYGVALAAIGFLSNLATGLSIDVYGPVCDNAGG